MASLEEAVSAAHGALPPAVSQDVDTTAALALVHELAWRVDPSCAAVRQLAGAIASLEAVGADANAPVLRDYARAASALAEREVAAVPTTSLQAAVRYVVVGTLFYEPVLLTLRRLAQQDAFTRHSHQERASGSTVHR